MSEKRLPDCEFDTFMRAICPYCQKDFTDKKRYETHLWNEHGAFHLKKFKN